MKTVMAWLTARNKAIMALLGVALRWAVLVIESPSGPITHTEWLVLIIGISGVFGVHQVTNNTPPAP
jgi:hypothetical protein